MKTIVGKEDQTSSETQARPSGDNIQVVFMPSEVKIAVEAGSTILDAALDAEIELDHNCGGNCACSTCHVIIESGFDTLEPITEDEEDMLDEAVGRTEGSRLACQCQLTDNVVVRIPDNASRFADFDDFD